MPPQAALERPRCRQRLDLALESDLLPSFPFELTPMIASLIASLRTRLPAAATAVALAFSLPAFLSCRSSGPGATASPGPVAGASSASPAGTSSGPAAPRSKADEPNTLHGVYSDVQADRGHRVYREICSECHESWDWTDPAFLSRWEEASVFRLWYWIYQRMPHGRPGTLTRRQVTDALAYILRLNGLPPGPAELGSDDDSLDDYWILWTKPPPPLGDDRTRAPALAASPTRQGAPLP